MSFPKAFVSKNRFYLPIWTVVGLEAIQELSTTWWGRVTEEPFGKAAGLSRPFKKKVSSSPFPFTKIVPRLTKRKPYSRRMACVSSTTCRGRTLYELRPGWPRGVHTGAAGPGEPTCSGLLQTSRARPLSLRTSGHRVVCLGPVPLLVRAHAVSRGQPQGTPGGSITPCSHVPSPRFVALSCQTQLTRLGVALGGSY